MKISVSSLIKYICGFFIALAVLSISTSCSRERFYTEPDAMLRFSLDTLRFDTVFTQRGSATRILKVFNPYNQSIVIENIFVNARSSSKFRLNIDGLPGNEGSNYRIAPKDSMYIFAEVTVNPDEPLSISPFVIEDHIVFITNGNEQRVVLEAWGQNANYIPAFDARGQQALLTCGNGEVRWDDPRPYVIYGVLAIDSCMLTIVEGTRIYVHGGFVRTQGNDFYNDGILFMLPSGRLNIRGSAERPVIIQTDRLEREFERVPGQYSGIRLGAGSVGPHVIEYADFRHAIIGLYADSASVVQVRNSMFRHCSTAGIVGIHANVRADNCLFHDNPGGGALMIYGGNYTFNYCTITNLNSASEALAAQNFICFDNLCTQNAVNPLDLTIVNSIIVNGGRDALRLRNGTPSQPQGFRYKIENSLLNLTDLTREANFINFFDNCNPCTTYTRGEQLFQNASSFDYRLDTMSVARGLARIIPQIPRDIINNTRKSSPDAGCYEFVE
jgi:hypothetical protein